jgi:hypothetical protein
MFHVSSDNTDNTAQLLHLLPAMWFTDKTAHARVSLPLPLPRPKQLTPLTPTKDASSPPHPSSQTQVGGTFVAHANVFAGFARAFVYALARTAVNAPQVCNLHR